MDCILKRRSIREYSNKAISNEDILTILKVAMSAPSARNQQPWHFVVVQKKEVLEKLAKEFANAGPLKTAPCMILLVSDKSNLSTPDMYIQDMSSATVNLMNAACKLGIGSCWMGTYPRMDRMNPLKEMFNIPENYEPFSMVSLGYPLEEGMFKEANRFKIDRIHYEKM